MPDPTQSDLFGYAAPSPLTDEELARILARSMTGGYRGCREADLFLASLCATHLVNALRLAGVRAYVPPM